MKENQQKIYNAIAAAAALKTPFDRIAVEQTPTFLQDPVRVADFAAGLFSAFGASIAEVGVSRGLPGQDVAVDRRHATLLFNDANYHYLNGVLILGGEIEVRVNSFYETSDGKWMCFNGAYSHLRNGILNYFDAANNMDALAAGVRKHSAAEIEADFEKLGLCVAPMHTYAEWLEHPQGKILAASTVISIKRHGDAKNRILPEAKWRPLEGVRVIDITHVIAGPWLTRVLAEQGADVISIRNPLYDFLYPAIFAESYGKKQIFSNFKSEKGKNRLAELIKSADVLVWGYHYPALERLGFSLDTLKALNPNLVLVHESAWGATGPWANRKGWEQLAQTTCGAVALVSEARGQNHLIGALPCDFGTGYLGAIGVMSALRQRQEQGGFWTVEATLARTIMQVLSLPPAKEDAVPVSNEEMPKYLIDQKSALNGATFTRLAPGARLSKTPSFAATGPAILGAHDPHKTTWDQPPFEKVPVPHQPSVYAKEGLTGVLTGYGHEDIMLRKSEANNKAA
ncbi:MAG: CoA transferase [Beijerinckiaceae bacterium]|jgi:crotonobetainyl-CoA:carnitine CoA-transferase CaiB-like acyl-CoA transferase